LRDYFFRAVDPFRANTAIYIMRRIYQFFNLFPSPIFAVMAVYQYHVAHSVCTAGAHIDTMLIMWILMALAHAPPWLLLGQQLYLARKAKTAVKTAL
jgi:hypothetical protein